MDVWSKNTLKSLLPGGVLLVGVAALVNLGWLPLAQPSLMFLYYAALVLGFLLSWRFHSSRVFFALLVLLLAEQAVSFFSSPKASPVTQQAALNLVAVLFSLDFVLLSFERERGFTSEGIRIRMTFLFVQCVAVAILSGIDSAPAFIHGHHHLTAIPLPRYVWLAFGIGSIVLLVRFLLFRKPAESALFWSLISVFLAIRSGGTDKNASAFFAGAAVILGFSIVETSYALAYHDELTTLPSRRAFNDALSRLRVPYSIAVVDIDHFKKFNDTYGHDIGDEVLRLVASKLARVTGGGEAYRCGGEEFSILFSGKTTAEVMEHLEKLRATVEAASFHMRGGDRRRTPRGPDRRNQASSRTKSQRANVEKIALPVSDDRPLSVTVSIGVATATRAESDPEEVIRSADKALYRAKASGRNRVESATSARRRTRVKAAGIA